MIKDSTQPILLQKLFELLEVHRKAFGQDRVYWRAVGMVLGEIFHFGRHTVTQVLMVLGITDGDWSGWYRLFSQGRYAEEKTARIFFRETLQHTSEAEPYVVGTDGVQIPRSSWKMPGTSWLKAPRTPVFKVGIHRAQRFVHGAWLTPLEAGYSRAVPLRFLPAFPPKAKPAGVTARTEGEAGLSFLHWTRQRLDEAGRELQMILALADGSFDTLNFWRGLPERTVLAVRTARNRRLYSLPEKREGPGRPASYGTLAPHPWEWLHKHISWQKRDIPVRGKTILMKFQVLGPFVREGLPEIPLFLFVVKGMHRKVGKKKLRWKHRKPSFYLVNAVQVHGEWQLPLPMETILAWLWQRWELEVAHREMKSGFGVGEKQCWNPRATLASVQWNVWIYALLLLSAYRTWGLLNAPPIPTRWWHGAKRWSFNTLWRQLRSALWGTPPFQAFWTQSSNNWLKKEAFLIALSNSITASARS
jgi:DDE superfamily endonuclease